MPKSSGELFSELSGQKHATLASNLLSYIYDLLRLVGSKQI